MNILFASDVSIKQLLGGAERGLYAQSVPLAKRGHFVAIITRKLASHSLDHEIIDGVHEYRYSIDPRSPLNYLCSTIAGAQKLYKKLNHAFDIINFHQPFTAMALNLLPVAKSTRKIYTCHSLSFEEYISRHQQANILNIWMRKAMERFSLKKADKILVLSQFTKDKLISVYDIDPSRISILPGSVDINRFVPGDKMKARSELNAPPNGLLLFTARNLVPRMGLENLITSMSLLVRQGIEAFLTIAGHGILEEKLRSLIKSLNLNDRVRLTGFLPDQELIKHYQSADFFILPTAELEGFGLVTIEAMACGTPVLATPVGGSVEILQKFDPQFLFQGTSPKEMAELIGLMRRYKEKPDDYRKLSESARKFVLDHYALDTSIETLETFLKT